MPSPILPDAQQFGQPFIGGISLSGGVARGAAIASGATANAANRLTDQIERNNYLQQREEERLADQQQRFFEKYQAIAESRDRAIKSAQEKSWFVRYETDLLKTGAAAADAANKDDPLTALGAYDAAWAPMREQIEGIADPDQKAEAELRFTRHYLGGKERVTNTLATKVSSSARTDITVMEQGYRVAVEDGSMNPVVAAAEHEASVRGLTGTAYTPEQARSVIERFDSEVAVTHANGFIVAGDPDGLAEWLATDFAKKNIDQSARIRMTDAAQRERQKADVQQVRSFIEEARNFSSAPPTQDGNSPSAWSDEVLQRAVEGNDRAVKAIMDLPGSQVSGAIVDGRVASEEDVRMAIFGKSLSAAAAKGDERAFSVLEKSLGESPEAGNLVEAQRKILSSVKDGERAKARRIDEIRATIASGGEPTQAFLSREAMDGYAKQQLASGVPVPAVAAELARYGTSVPKSLIDAIGEGFTAQATPRDIAMSLAAIDAYSSVDPSAGLRIASSVAEPDMARILASMPFVTDQDKAEAVTTAQLLLTQQGRDAIGYARQLTTKGADNAATSKGDSFPPFSSQESLLKASNGNIDFTSHPMPRNADDLWRSEFTIELARMGVTSGVATETLQQVAETASSRAAVAVMDNFDAVPIEPDVSFLGTVPGRFGPSVLINPWGRKGRTTLVDKRFFGLNDDRRAAFSEHMSSVMNLQTIATQGVEVRPDMALVDDVMVDGSPRRMTLVPIVSGTMPVAYATWDPVTGTPGPTMTLGTPGFDNAVARTLNFNPVEDMDADRIWRRKATEEATWMANSDDLGTQAIDSFEETMTFRYDELSEHDMSREEYLDAMARSLGWRGWTDPNAAEKRSRAK